jgi:hypothetical protein
MGSIISKPPKPEPLVYTPPPKPEPQNSAEDQEKAAAMARKRALPETILTSFRGVLTPGGWVPQRKSLLGE